MLLSKLADPYLCSRLMPEVHITSPQEGNPSQYDLFHSEQSIYKKMAYECLDKQGTVEAQKVQRDTRGSSHTAAKSESTRATLDGKATYV